MADRRDLVAIDWIQRATTSYKKRGNQRTTFTHLEGADDLAEVPKQHNASTRKDRKIDTWNNFVK